MKYFNLLCFTLALAVAIPTLAKKPKDKNKYGVYIVGVSASFTDSLIYLTDIQRVDSAELNEKGLLQQRAQYSTQLKEYLEAQGKGQNRTCFVYFNQKKKKLQKEVTKLKQKYQKGSSILLKDVDSAFKFEKAEVY